MGDFNAPAYYFQSEKVTSTRAYASQRLLKKGLLGGSTSTRLCGRLQRTCKPLRVSICIYSTFETSTHVQNKNWRAIGRTALENISPAYNSSDGPSAQYRLSFPEFECILKAVVSNGFPKQAWPKDVLQKISKVVPEKINECFGSNQSRRTSLETHLKTREQDVLK